MTMIADHGCQLRVLAFALLAAVITSCGRQPAAPKGVRLGIDQEAARRFAELQCKGCGRIPAADAILNVATALAALPACHGVEVTRYDGSDDQIARKLDFEWVLNIELMSSDDRQLDWMLQAWKHGEIIYQGEGDSPANIAREVCAILLHKGAVEGYTAVPGS